MTLPISRLRIAGTELPIATHHLSCQVQVTRDALGRRTLSVSASGHAPPALTAVTWTSAVTVEWRDLESESAAWTALAILSAGWERTDDLSGITVAWSLKGVEASATASPVTLGGTHYWGTVQVSAPRALTRRQVQIKGEGVSAPTAAGGSVTVASGPFNGSLITLGVASQTDAATGLISWTLDGWEAPSGGALISLGAATYWASVEVSTGRSGARKTLRVSGESVAVPATVGAAVTLTSAAYTGTFLVGSVTATQAPETGLLTWQLSGWDGASGAGAVSLAGTSFWGRVAREPLGGVIQRKTDGSGTFLHAWAKSRVTITGDGASAPAVSGVVAVVSSVYSGNLLVAGTSVSLDPETGLVSWTVAGEQP